MSAIDGEVLAALRASVGEDDAFVVDLAETYLDDARAQLEALEAAAGAPGGSEALVRPAHSLKTGSLTMGATRLGELSRELELAARSGTVDDVPARVRAIREEWSRVEPELRSWIAERSGG